MTEGIHDAFRVQDVVGKDEVLDIRGKIAAGLR